MTRLILKRVTQDAYVDNLYTDMNDKRVQKDKNVSKLNVVCLKIDIHYCIKNTSLS